MACQTGAGSAADGDRFLGGRPPYGYRLVDAGPHPNPAKATAGQRLHRLEADPVTAPVVQRIFALYAEGHGLRYIAQALTDDDILSPAGYDRARNRHRDPRGWSHTAVRTILDNPVYAGKRVWGKQRRHEELLDVEDVAVGHITKMRRQPPSDWIEGAKAGPPALVDPPTWAAAASRLGTAPQRTRSRATNHLYLLRGLVLCGICGRRLQGSARPSRSHGGATRILYRCEFGTSRSVPRDMDHPSTVYVRENAITGPLDEWLATIITPEALAAAQTPPAPTARDAATRAAIADCDLRIERLLASVEEGMPKEWIAQRVVRLRVERDRLEGTLPDRVADRPLSPGEIEALAGALGGIVRVLERASPEDRAAVYRELNLRLTYDPTQRQVHASVDLARVGRGVGGGT